MLVQESRAVTGRTARCRCKFRYVSDLQRHRAVSLPQHGFLVGLQTAVNHLPKVKLTLSTRKNKSYHLFNAGLENSFEKPVFKFLKIVSLAYTQQKCAEL